MKNALFITVTLSLVIVAGAVFGEPTVREILLKDGSVIRAEILSFEDGVYSLRSETMGELRLQDSAIETIRLPDDGRRKMAGAESSGGPDNQTRQKNVKNLQSSMLSSPALLSMIFALQEDPDVQDILSDEEVMGLIMTGDMDNLEDNPQFIRLMENPKIRAIIDRMTN